jgi:uncharacterized protein (DUF302 family)
MNNIYSRKLSIPFGEALAKVTECLNRRGFEIITTIDIKRALKEKMKIDFRNYVILGACNPEFAYKAISLESHVGNLLACNLVVQQHENGEVEISAVNPLETMDKVLSTDSLTVIAADVGERLRASLDDLHRKGQPMQTIDAIPNALGGLTPSPLNYDYQTVNQ